MTEHDGGPIGSVREGMSVVDESGRPFGTVREVASGRAEGGPEDLPDTGQGDGTAEQDARLLSLGYLRVERVGGGGEQLVAADLIAGVDGDTVQLRLAPNQI